MPKINQEEYEVLKSRRGINHEWIVRNSMDWLVTSEKKPYKSTWSLKWLSSSGVEPFTDNIDSLFQFIQWEDEPHNIAELIEEYEKDYKGSWEHAIEFSGEVFGESEETEVKKDKTWAIKEAKETINGFFDRSSRGVAQHYEDELIASIADIINQLDESEVLSEEWLVEHSYNVHLLGTPDVETVAVPRDNLEGILVPKQEVLTDEQIARKVDQAYKDGYEKGKQHTFYKGYLEGLADKEKEPETVASVMADFFGAAARLKEVLAMEVEELEE